MTRSNGTETQIWQEPDLGAELLRGRFCDFSYDVHTHDTACFALLTGGAIEIEMRGGVFIARRGDLYAIPADEPHAGRPIDADGWTLRTVYVDMDVLRSVAGDERSSANVTLAGPILRDTVLSSALYEAHRCSQEGRLALFRDERYAAFAARLFERHVSSAPISMAVGDATRAVRLAREFLDERLDARVSLGDVGHAAGLPPYRLFRAFSRDMGMTPHAYQRQARVRAAMRLIRYGRPLSDVAAETGFADQAHLTRSFRRIMGVTPGAYQLAVRA